MRVLHLLSRFLGILLILLVILAIVARLALNTDYIRDTLRRTAIESVPGLELGRITGDLWHGFVLHDVIYSDSSLTVTIDSVMVGYHVWGMLNGIGDIRHVDVYRPVVHARPGLWSTDADTSAFDLPFDILIGSLTVRDGSLNWNDIDWLSGITVDASGQWKDHVPSVTLNRFETSVVGSGLDSTSVRLYGQSEGSAITLEQLVVATGRSLLIAKGNTDLADESVSGTLEFSPLAWRDIVAFAGDLPLQDDLDMSLTIAGTYGALDLLLDVRSNRYPRVSMGMTFTADSLNAAGTVHTGRTPVTFTAKTDWSAKSPGVDLTVNAARFDARSIDGFSDFPTSINLTMAARLVDGAVNATLDVTPSTLNNVPVRSIRAALRFADGIVTVSQGSIRSDIINGDFQLRQRLDDPSDLANRLDANFTLIDLQPFAPLAGLDSLSATGSVVATLARGTGGVLRFDAELDLRDVLVDTIRVAHLNSRMEGEIGAVPTLSANLNLNDIRIGDLAFPFASLRAVGHQYADRIESFVAVEGHISDDLSFVHEGDMILRDGNIRHLGTRLDVLLMNERYRLTETFDLRYIDSELLVDRLRMTGTSGSEVSLDASQLGSRTELALAISNADLHIIDTMTEFGAGIRGRLSLDATILLIDGASPDVRFSAHTIDAVISDVAIDSVRVSGTLVRERLDLNATARLADAPWLDLDISLPFLLSDPVSLNEGFFRKSVTGHFTLHPTKLESLGGWMKAMSLEPIPGLFQASLLLGGTAGHPTFSGDIRLLRSTVSAVPIDSLGLEFSFDAGDEFIQLASTLVSLGQPALDLEGRIPFDMDMRRFTPIFNPENPGLELDFVTRQFNLGALSVFTNPQTLRRLQGRMNGDVSVRGSLHAPTLSGQFAISGASMYLPQQNISVSDIGLDLRLEPGRVLIQEGRLRSNGLAQLRGTVDLDGFGIRSLDVTLKGESLRLSDTRNALVYLSVDTRLRGTIAAPKLSGSLTLDRGHLFMEEFGENQVEQVILSDDDIGFLDGLDLYENLEMELVFGTTRGFWVRNRSAPEINLELNGELDILKSKGGDILLFGSMGTNQGNVSQLGKRFILESGTLTFSGDAANPQLAIRSLYELRQPNDIKIWYVIGGTVVKPIFTFESDPEMDQQDIVSYTLFSRPFQQLMSWEQTMSGSSSVGNLAVDLLMDRVGELAADRLGLDVIEIDNSRTSGNSGTTIKAGKYINDRLFVAIFQELGTTSDSQVILEYALRRHLNLILTGSDKRKSGIDIQWKYDY